MRLRGGAERGAAEWMVATGQWWRLHKKKNSFTWMWTAGQGRKCFLAVLHQSFADAAKTSLYNFKYKVLHRDTNTRQSDDGPTPQTWRVSNESKHQSQQTLIFIQHLGILYDVLPKIKNKTDSFLTFLTPPSVKWCVTLSYRRLQYVPPCTIMLTWQSQRGIMFYFISVHL